MIERLPEEGRNVIKILQRDESRTRDTRNRGCRSLKRSSMEAKYAENQVRVVVMSLTSMQHTELKAEWIQKCDRVIK